MKILIISNFENEDCHEDLVFAKSFKEDGHEVGIVGMDYDEKFDDIYDIFIRRCTWYDSESELIKYNIETNKLLERLKIKRKKLINDYGIFDANGKKYLIDLYNKGFPVIPTFDDLNNIGEFNSHDVFIIKLLDSYDGFGMKVFKKNELVNNFSSNYIIQPKIDFISEVQFYFINRDFQYALEFIPSKIPNYPDAIEYNFTKDELKLAQSFADLNKNLIGIQRIDFIKLKNKKLLLLEIEDVNPYLDFDCLTEKKQKDFLKNFKEVVYKLNNN